MLFLELISLKNKLKRKNSIKNCVWGKENRKIA